MQQNPNRPTPEAYRTCAIARLMQTAIKQACESGRVDPMTLRFLHDLGVSETEVNVELALIGVSHGTRRD